MYQIVGNNNSGKTKKLMLLAQEHNGVLICANPHAMREKAKAYGLTGFDIVSYRDFFDISNVYEKPCFIDEIDKCLMAWDNVIAGYSLTLEG